MSHLRVALLTSLLWLIGLSSCAGLTIKTWFADSSQVRTDCREEKLLIRRDHAGAVKEALSLLQSDAYRCYSPADDSAWRNRLALAENCCGSCQR